ncbi:LysE family translocator [Fodinicurvata sediminis]|uniref:LysE family translocator n=1 Tax=Fodinicurvata sediminis TaxID=1121832 RepID=UPI0003B797A1|nr:LysE family transporter [Fodinicurvata sediminis]
MDLLPLFIQALVIGFALAIPLGPIGLLCIERTLSRGIGAGLSTGLGVAVADAIFAALVAYGARWVADEMLPYRDLLRYAGGLVIILLGVRTCLQSPKTRLPRGVSLSGSTFLTSFMLTLANPLVLVGFIAIFAALDLGEVIQSNQQALQVIGGIFLGSMVWWLCLTGLMAAIRHHLGQRTLVWLNRGAGAVLILLGILVMIFGGK